MKSQIHNYQNKYLKISKRLFAVLAICLMSISSFAQQGINYKALIKDDNGNVLSNEEVTIRFTILDAFSDGNIAYQGTHYNVMTDTNGIAIVNIGEGFQSLSYGFFSELDWGTNAYYLRVEIGNAAGLNFVDMGTTQFMAVPYALNAANVSGLEKITESVSPDTGLPYYGWRLIGQNPDSYGNIGLNAVDLSQHTIVSDSWGATGKYAFAAGGNTRASESYSTAMGYATHASGSLSTAIGYFTIAEASNSTAIGQWNVGGGNPYLGIPTDPIFEIGIGLSSLRKNALTVLKNGTITAPSFSVSEINAAGEVALITKEYADIYYTTANGDATVGGAITIQNASDATSTWRLETRPNGSLSLYRNGNYRGYFSESTGVYGSISDRRLKRDITAIENGTLHKVMQLNPVSYLMKDQTDTKRNLGLISQEVQVIFPSITNHVEEADLITLSYTELIPVLIKALQEQQTIIEAQKAKDVVQDESIDALVTRLNLIESKSSN